MSPKKKAKINLYIELHNHPDACKWQQAIEDGEVMIMEHKKRIRQLQRAIGIFRENVAQGVAWPRSREAK